MSPDPGDRERRPRLVYDGDCAFCRYTVAYARAAVGDRVEFRPFQEVVSEHPGVSEAEFAASIQLFTADGRCDGAEAAFRVLAASAERRHRLWLRIYQLPGIAWLFEWLYRVVAARRELCYRLIRVLCGQRLVPRRHLETADWLYRGIALCGVLAFASLWWQVAGLIGSGGVLPVADYLAALEARYGAEVIWSLPSLLWLSAEDWVLHGLCAVGLAATLVGAAGRLRATMALLAYVCYLSLVHGGQVFTGYQWDILLVECFVLQLLLARLPTLGVWVARALLFRFMLLSGVVKLASGDPSWWDGSALGYHFETQPLPTVFAWYADKLPDALLRLGVYGTLVIELVVPFFVFLPRNPRLLAAVAFVLLEGLIMLTGSYNFFNLLTLVLCLSLLDDDSLRAMGRHVALRGIRPPTGGRWLSRGLALVVLVLGMTVTWTTVRGSSVPSFVRLTSPWLLANRYGLFAVMTKTRDELVVEGSADGITWKAYGFPFKPGPLDVPPRLATPHQPRLDWQLWFAALTTPDGAPWISDFVYALLEARPAVLGLLEDPFAGEPPGYVRIRAYRYRFTSAGERAERGHWWARERPRPWLGPVELRRPVIRHEPLRLE